MFYFHEHIRYVPYLKLNKLLRKKLKVKDFLCFSLGTVFANYKPFK